MSYEVLILRRAQKNWLIYPKLIMSESVMQWQPCQKIRDRLVVKS